MPSTDFSPIECLDAEELSLRQNRCRTILSQMLPEADGLLLTGRSNIYYLTGTLATGLFWLPKEGEPVLFVRKGIERAHMESRIKNILSFRSYKEIRGIAQEVRSPLGAVLAVDKNNLSWSASEMLSSRLQGISFLSGDAVLSRARAVKTAFEQERIKACGRIHRKLLDEILPSKIQPGMTEWEISSLFISEGMRLGSECLSRLTGREEMFHGHLSAGLSGVYPSYFNGPLGCRGVHPAVPYMGAKDVIWEKEQVLLSDMSCSLGSYNTDRTQAYWSGTKESVPTKVRAAQDACIEILNEAVATLRPEYTPMQVWTNALASAKRLGFAEGFMGIGANQVPFLGHGLGLELDEWPPLAKGFTDPFLPGMIIAIEPKIGLAGLGMVGVEHSYLVTENAPEPLTGTQTDFIYL